MIKKSRLNTQYINSGFNELRKRIFFVIVALIIFRIGSFIPIPGINTTVLSKFLDQQQGTIIEMFNMFSGGALSRASIFALGIMPYISASIIVQLLTLVYPFFSEMKKEGEIGRRKINQYTRYATLILSILQAFGIVTSLSNISIIHNLVMHLNFCFYFTAILSLVTGTIFLMWLGELITERGIGNGISIIIFIGIISGLPTAIGRTIEQTRQGSLHILIFILILILIFLITYFVVFIERSQRKIVVCYARRQQGHRVYASQSTHLPLKLNIAGVIPAIFASSIVLFPTTIISWFGIGYNEKWNWIASLLLYLQPSQPIYVFLYAIAIIFFCFFYGKLIFNPRETADNLKKSGAFIPGIRPGEQTAKHIEKIVFKLTFIGSLYVAFICLIPELMRNIINVPFYFGGTSLLIVVVVIIDFISQIQTIMMSSQYGSILKKAHLNLK